MTVTVRGAEQFFALARRLKDAADKDLTKELNKGVRQAVRPFRGEYRASARRTLPRRGGLGVVISQAKVTTSRRSTGSSAGIRVKTTGQQDLGAINRGAVRHPLFDNRRRWYVQRVPPGFWDRAREATQPEARRQLEQSMEAVKDKIDRRL